MTTTINKTNGTVLVTISDGAVDTSASGLALIGKLYRNYGELVNENFVKLAENFANAASPTNPLIGQLWYDTANRSIKVYRSTGFVSLSVLNSSSSEPTNPGLADLWWDTVDAQLKLYNGTTWRAIFPGYTTDQGISGSIVETVQDTLSASHVITKVYIGGTVVAIYSKDDEFTPSSTIVGFSTIKKGLNINSNSGYDIHGNITADSAATWTTARTLSLTGDITGTSAAFDGSGNISISTTITANSVELGADTTGNYASAVAVSGNGLVITGVAGEGTAYTITSNATSTNTPNTIVYRDASGNFNANLITATTAQSLYADLAEKYTTDQEYPIGTVVSVCEHNDHDVEAANTNSIAIGVISANPAYLMNSESAGQAVGLKGRVPVRIVGAVKKGQAVYCGNNGTANTVLNGCCLVGIALESNEDESEKLVECVLKL